MILSPPDSDIRVRARLLQIVASLERVGVTPVSNRDLHSIAYLSNVLSPLWEVEPLETSVLKDRNGPRSSILEHEIDLCVGNGLLIVETLTADPENPSQLSASYRLNARVALPIVAEIAMLPDEQPVTAYLNEIAFAFSEIQPGGRDDLALQDAAWSNPSIAAGRIVDFANHQRYPTSNLTVQAAEAFQKYAPAGFTYNRAEKLLMYMRLLNRRAHG